MKPRHLSVILAACVLSLFFARIPVASAAPPVTAPALAPLLTPEETKEAHAVFAAMAAGGFPDTQKARVYRGALLVFAKFDPHGEARPLPAQAAKTRMMVPDTRDVTHGYIFQGLHFKLPDGSWIIALAYHFKPRPGDEVKMEDATEVKVATLTADAMAAHPYDAATMASNYLAQVPPAYKARSTAAMDRFVPVMQYLGFDRAGVVQATVLLHRAGWKDAADLSLLLGEFRARSFWELQLWDKPDWAYDPTGVFLKIREEATAWSETQKSFPSESPPVALRRALFRWCRGQMSHLNPEDALLPLNVAAICAKAAVDPKDPQNNIARIDALLAGMKLPVLVEAEAPLIARLQRWEENPRPSFGDRLPGEKDPGYSAYTPQKSDLDALVALLADERPSRFCDFTGPRTLGDNAWRAVALLLKNDPRTLAGYPTDHPWTAAERKAAANAVQAWWKVHRGEFVAK